MTDTHYIGKEIITTETQKKTKWTEVTEAKLLKFRKYFILLSALMAVTMVTGIYVHGLNVNSTIDGILALVFLIFSTKCETRILKMKIEKSLQGKLD
jgi:hypothetical protein